MKTVKIIIFGLVHGVGFRDYAKRKAAIHGIKGSVTNKSEGNVEIIVQGRDNEVKQFIQLMKKGPSTARIDDFIVEEMDEEGKYERFEVRR